jgi:hypothetical protein
VSTVIADKRFSRFQVVHIILAFVVALSGLSLFMMDDAVYKVRMQVEVSEAKKMLSKEDWEAIEEKVTRRYTSFYYDSGLYEQVNKSFIPRTEHIGSELVDNSRLYRLVNNTSIFFYQVVYRVTTLEYWLSLVSPFMVCLVVHGFYRWRINRYRMGGANTSRARIYMKLIWFSIVSLFIMLAMPNYFSSIGVFVPVSIMLLVAFVLSRFIASYQKDF